MIPCGVRFKTAGRIYYFDAGGVPKLSAGDRVIVETSRGRELGSVVIAPGQVVDAPTSDLKPILRPATWADLNELARLRMQESAALDQARERIAAHELPMKAVCAEYTFDGSRLTIYFVSDERRVDFRELVRDLARTFRTRVILHHIGPRDHAKLLGGIDRCGRELCCSTWMTDFQPISIRMAKNQGLPLNPAEISGVCGKLLCCLAFEDDQYEDLQAGMPRVGAQVTSAVGRGRVVDVNPISGNVTVQWETGSRVVISVEELQEQMERRRRAFGDEAPPTE